MFRSKVLRLTLLLAAGLMVMTSLPASVMALTSEDIDSVNSGTAYYRPEGQDSTSCSTSVSVSSTLPTTVPEPHRSLFTQAAAAYKINPQYLTALFLSEHADVWVPFDGPWATSPVGATGPFQFMPGTWSAYKADGNNDGVMDVNNMSDAAYAAANLLSKNGITESTPLGDINKPFAPGTMLFTSAVYNWGGGNVQRFTNADSPITAAPPETQNYMKNVFALVSSGFTKSGFPNIGDPKPPGETSAAPATNVADTGLCSAGVIAGNVVQTAVNLAWDTPGHGKNKSDAKPSYQTAMPQFNGSTGDDEWSDCGVFVATVMVASGADPAYPKRGTTLQEAYILAHPEKYQTFTGISSTAELQAGDIFVNTQHTYIYTDNQTSGYNAVAASLHDHVPQVSRAYFDLNGEHFLVARLKK